MKSLIGGVVANAAVTVALALGVTLGSPPANADPSDLVAHEQQYLFDLANGGLRPMPQGGAPAMLQLGFQVCADLRAGSNGNAEIDKLCALWYSQHNAIEIVTAAHYELCPDAPML